MATSASAAKPPSSSSFWGISNHVAVSGTDAAEAARAGAGSMLVLLSWPAVERQPGVYDWSSTDRQVASVAAAGMRPVIRIWGNRYAADPATTPMASKTARARWYWLIRAAAKRYGAEGDFWLGRSPAHPVRSWQILNEPNSTAFHRPKPNPGQYAKLIKLTDKALAAEDRSAELILGGMFGSPGYGKSGIPAWDFLRKLYRSPNIKRSFEAIALHPYAPTTASVAKQIELSREVARRAGDRKVALYITEIGWSSATPGQLDHRQAKGLGGQAKMLRDAFKLFTKMRSRWRLAGVYWYALQDHSLASSDPCVWCEQAGLLAPGGKPKPAWTAYRSFATRSPKAK